ncbi:hypothetical protein H7K45_27615 [Mycobacterium yunnanensis]|uniref:Lysin B n=1 Tax=Mycobacterium yunnanensis TaxID=368477 RepID=A0A9X2ZBB3_9MYCO|nr:hypothetical protein [Mycobacterium yunnanensis]MCV7424322.1 hypothetical protein [Mycobacterium yunnanensis]
MAWAPASRPGDTDPLIPKAKQKLAGNSYGKAIGTDRSTTYTEAFGAALTQYGINVHADVLKGKRAAPDVNTTGVFDWAIKTQMQLLAPPAPPKPWEPRIPAFCFRGTGGIVGLDPVSRVCQRLGGLVEEINTPWAATMGGIPVGASGGIGDPSMWSGIQAGLVAAQNEFLARRAVNPGVKIIIQGYSAGAVLAALFKQWVLENFPENYVASASFGDPTRPVGGGFYGRPAPWGDGIADFAMGDPKDYRHAWLTHEKDMYAQIPGGMVGDIMDDVYAEVSRFAFTDIVQVTIRMVQTVPAVAAKAGISIPGALASLAGGPVGVIGFALPLLLQSMGGLIPTGQPVESLTGPAAAAKAATLGLEFLFAGTGPHIRYEFDEAWPGGPTFVDFAAMHFRDYIGRLRR